MTRVIFAADLTLADRSVVSQKTLDIIKAAAVVSANTVITITSTRRSPEKQATVMLDNLNAGRRISYAAPGREVVGLYDTLKSKEYSIEAILYAMADRIEELAQVGKKVSKHCVTKAQYAACNIVDVSARMPNPRDFVKAILKSSDTFKVITPYASSYSDARVSVDSNEPAIHLEIKQ